MQGQGRAILDRPAEPRGSQAEGAGHGTIVISSSGKRRASTAPIPYHSGSPLASTVTRRPRRAAISSSVAASGRRQTLEPLGEPMAGRYHREMPGAADQNFRSFDQGARRRADPGNSVLADPDDAEPAFHVRAVFAGARRTVH